MEKICAEDASVFTMNPEEGREEDPGLIQDLVPGLDRLFPDQSLAQFHGRGQNHDQDLAQFLKTGLVQGRSRGLIHGREVGPLKGQFPEVLRVAEVKRK